MSTFTKDTTTVSWEIEGGGQQRTAKEGGMVIAATHDPLGLGNAVLKL